VDKWVPWNAMAVAALAGTGTMLVIVGGMTLLLLTT
jgi:hypothetical protein